jgi:hypothetical protein
LELLELLELQMHAVAMRRPRKTVQNEEELARSCRTAVMAIGRGNALASRNGMFVSTRFFSALIVVVLVL